MQPAGKSATHIEIAALDWGFPVGGTGDGGHGFKSRFGV